MNSPKLRGDFNGLFDEILCLSHSDTCLDENGMEVQLREGLIVTAFEEDADEHGNRDDIIARGMVEPAPDWLRSHGSKWILRVDENGVRHESDLKD